MIGIVAALRTEIDPFLASPHPPRFLVRVAGIGAARAAAAAEDLLPMCDRLISAGFCAGGVEGLSTGDVIVDGELEIPGARRGKILTVNRVLRGDEIRRACAEAGAMAIEMEASAVAKAAAGRPFAAVKVVLDTIESPLACDYSSIGGVLARPWLWPGVMRDARRAKLAARALADALNRIP